ncbi:MAG: DUF4250 domain-containing protein [Muribaculaceae bacterium]|nr:DUF4250 domain-containing protein [Muribaculaceae bacterium]
MNLPTDPNMLYSLINMKLRDEYPNLDSLCQNLDIDKSDLCQQLADSGFHYDPINNRFI